MENALNWPRFQMTENIHFIESAVLGSRKSVTFLYGADGKSL